MLNGLDGVAALLLLCISAEDAGVRVGSDSAAG